MSELERRHHDGAITFEPVAGERRALLKRTICKDLTDNEMDLFVSVCNRRRLDPFVRQIHAVKRRQWNAKLKGGQGDYEEVMVIQTGIDGYRLVADRTQQRDGTEGPWWCGTDGVWREVWLSAAPPAAAKFVAYRKGHTRGYVGIAHWTEYVQTYKDKKGVTQTAPMWRDMPAGQLAKCAEALAMRKAFPEELGGMYTDEEMGQATTQVEIIHDPGRLGGTPQVAQPAGTIPTREQIGRLRTIRQAKELVQAATPLFTGYVQDGIAALWPETAPRDFWDTANVAGWQEALEYALELHEQREHETSAVDGAAPPAATADPTSDPPAEGDTAGGSEPNLLEGASDAD